MSNFMQRPPSDGLSVLPIRGKKDQAPLYPGFITGFADAKSSFIIEIWAEKSQTGWKVKASFEFCLHIKDKELLESIKEYFKVGNIYKNRETFVYYKVRSKKDLAVIIDHAKFDKIPLKTQKRADFELFKQVVDLMNRL